MNQSELTAEARNPCKACENAPVIFLLDSDWLKKHAFCFKPKKPFEIQSKNRMKAKEFIILYQRDG